MRSFLVIGLGRFGSALARELASLGQEVLALDEDEENVQHIADDVTQAFAATRRMKRCCARSVRAISIAASLLWVQIWKRAF